MLKMLNLKEREIERKLIDLDPDLSAHYLTFNTYKVQREVRPAHMAELTEKMKKGLFHVGRVIFARIMINGKPVDIMMDGQHICLAVVETGETVGCLLQRYEVRNKRELSVLFRQCENLPRSIEDMVKAEAYALGLTWPKWIASLTVKAASIDRYGSSKLHPVGGVGSVTAPSGSLSRITKGQRVRLLEKYLKEGNFLNEVLIGGRRACAHLNRQAVALIIMRTFRVDKKAAKDFWGSVRDGEFLSRDMPEMRLREFLKRTYPGAQRPLNHEYAYRCSLAWNAYREKRSTKLAYRKDAPIPKLK